MQKRILCFFMQSIGFGSRHTAKTSPALSRMLPIISLSQCTPEISRPTTIRAVNAASRGRRMCRTAGQRMRRCSFSLNSIKHLFSCRVSACFTVPLALVPCFGGTKGFGGSGFSSGCSSLARRMAPSPKRARRASAARSSFSCLSVLAGSVKNPAAQNCRCRSFGAHPNKAHWAVGPHLAHQLPRGVVNHIGRVGGAVQRYLVAAAAEGVIHQLHRDDPCGLAVHPQPPGNGFTQRQHGGIGLHGRFRSCGVVTLLP